MRRSLPVASLLASAVVAIVAVSSSCIGKSPYSPGTSLGTFGVTGHVQTNNCLAAPDPWTFSVKLAEDPGIFYWVQNDVPVEGTLDTAGNVNLTSTSTEIEDPADDAGNGGCTMQRVDTLTGTTSGSPINGLTGTLTYAFSAASGDCSDQLSVNGGTYATIPCTLSYAITAAETAGPDGGTPNE